MKILIRKTAILIAILMFSIIKTIAQDVIIKNDKTEIKSKISEITETAIKYKKWENLEGPTYNIEANEVFMIIYANGQREIINQTSRNSSKTSVVIPNDSKNNTIQETGLASQINQTSKSGIDTTIDFKNIRVKYKPTRILIGLQLPVSLGANYEFRIVKNILNLGTEYLYIFPENDYILEANYFYIYVSLYAPINRLSGKFEKQDKGLFVFLHTGYSASSIKNLDYYGNTQSFTSGGLTWSVGLDYYLSDGFGFTLSTDKFSTFYSGIAISF